MNHLYGKPNLGAEVCVTAYNGASARTAKCESIITGEIIKITEDYVWVRDSRNGSTWKSPRRFFA
jgi:hypothetical protein